MRGIGCAASPEPAPSREAGFTLLEVLVALGMSVVLVSGIYAALNLYIRVTQEDATVLERSRVSRAVFRQMSRDIQSVLFRIPEETNSTDETTETSTSESSSTTEGDSTSTTETETTEIDSVVDPEAAMTSTSVGLIGDAGKLTLHISRPARDMQYAALADGAGVAARTSDLLSVTYFLADAASSGLEGAVGQLAQQDAGESQLTSSGTLGLARLAGDRMAIEYADLEADVDSLAAAAKVIAPEVTSLEFRYFDGLTWQSEWDSVASERLPNAVEITLGLKRIISAEERLANQFNSAARSTMDQTIEYRRHVVALPLAEPYAEGL